MGTPDDNPVKQELAVKDENAIAVGNVVKIGAVYCYDDCVHKGSEHDYMVVCSGENCKGVRFHTDCIGWTKDISILLNWFCKDCNPDSTTGKENVIPEENYCYCDRGFFGRMIRCDGEGCEFKWFHFECIGWSRAVPHGVSRLDFFWFCHVCRLSRKDLTYDPSQDA